MGLPILMSECDLSSVVAHTVFRRSRRYDPTHTTQLRKRFSANMGKRFRALRGLIRKTIVQEDCFGLRGGRGGPVLQYRQFAFPRSADKVEAFI